MSRYRLIGGPHAGVYVVECPKGFYVGQAVDCVRRNLHLTQLGIDWQVVWKMPGSTKGARIKIERLVADVLEHHGFCIVSRNTTATAGAALRGRKRDPAIVAKTAKKLRGQKRTLEQRARITAGILGRAPPSESTRAKMADACRRSWQNSRIRRQRTKGVYRSWQKRKRSARP